MLAVGQWCSLIKEPSLSRPDGSLFLFFLPPGVAVGRMVQLKTLSVSHVSHRSEF